MPQIRHTASCKVHNICPDFQGRGGYPTAFHAKSAHSPGCWIYAKGYTLNSHNISFVIFFSLHMYKYLFHIIKSLLSSTRFLILFNPIIKVETL